jgi:NAD(P)-dependent dehydrogenase (short-subunit alcohol dehydrogenase family)
MESKVWFITGCSTGFGRLLCESVLKTGDRVVVTARDLKDVEDIIHLYPYSSLCIRMDVTDHGSIETAVNRACAAFGQIDILVNNAGFGVHGAFEEIPDSWVRKEFETNFFGLLDVTREVIPVMRMQRSGKIFNFSSIVGRMAHATMGIYSATKFAIEGFSEALRLELETLGITVTIIEPGAYDTDFGQRSMVFAEPLPQYAELHAAQTQSELSPENKYGDLGLAVECILSLAEMSNPPLRAPLGPETLPRIINKLKADIASYEETKQLWEKTNFVELRPRVRPIRGKKTHSHRHEGVNNSHLIELFPQPPR